MADGKCPVCGKDHFGLCHKCPHAEEAKWRRVKWEETPCAACRLAEVGRAAGHGRGLSLEHVPERELVAVAQPAEAEEEYPVVFLATDPREVVSRIRRFVRAILAATLDELQWIQDALRQTPPAEVAARDGITSDRARARRARALRMLGWNWDARRQDWQWTGGGAGESGPDAETSADAGED